MQKTVCLLILVILQCMYASMVSGMEISLTQISDKIYLIYGPLDQPSKENRGFRNNPVIVLTSAGVVVLDPGGSAWSGEMVVDKIKSITRDPIVAVFNSHAHGDHWLGNEGVRRAYPEAVIYGHPVMTSRINGSEGIDWLEQIERLTENTGGGKAVVAPNLTVNNNDVIDIGDTKFRIHHTGPAHTDSDIMIEIVDQQTLYTGDVVRNKLLGLMRSDSSFIGNIAAIEAMVKMGFKYYIPGHGKVGGAEIALDYRNYLESVYSTVKQLYEEELEDFEMKPAVLDAVSAYKDWVGFDLRLGANVSRAYLEVESEEF